MKGLQGKKVDYKEAIFIVVSTFLWNCSVYFGARLLTTYRYHYDMTVWIDGLFPFLPWTVLIYFSCYLFWVVNYFLCAIQDQKKRDRFFCGEVMAKGICFLLFLLIPTTNTRPEILGEGLWNDLMRLLYWIDAPDNLFPSLHCLVSWFCWIGVRRNEEVPFWYRNFSFFAALVICVVTLTTKQHVIADVIGGVLLAEVCYWIAGFGQISTVYSAGLSGFKKLFKI